MRPGYDRNGRPPVPQAVAPRGTLTTGGRFSKFPDFSVARKSRPPFIMVKIQFHCEMGAMISDPSTFR